MFESEIYSQEEGRIHIPKCARIEPGFIFRRQISDSTDIDLGGSISYSYCIKSAKRAGVGVGSSVEFFQDDAFIPLYLDGIYFLTKNSKGPFLHAQAGYAFGFLQETEPQTFSGMRGGFYAGGGLGCKVYSTGEMAFYLSATYHYQNASFYRTDHSSGEDHVHANYNLFVMSFGIILEQP
jgi:hypothetical protein